MIRAACCAFVFLALMPAPAHAWGTNAHRYIMGKAIDLLPPEIKPFFEHFRAELVVRVVDPDGWRSAGWDEDANHYLDFGGPELGPYPFAALPREYGAAIEKFGMAALKRFGLLPWREAEEFGNLRRAMEGFTRGSLFAPGDSVLFAAVASHYIQDAHVPLHATNNHDGQLTGQHGVHARFESILFDRFQSRLSIKPAAMTPMRSPRDAAFEVLLASFQLVEPLLAADKEASAGKDTYDDDYYEKFFAGAGPILERRIADSVAATASMIVGAWEAAGRPALKTAIPPPVQKVRSPK